jgi:hypothetical protein
MCFYPIDEIFILLHWMLWFNILLISYEIISLETPKIFKIYFMKYNKAGNVGINGAFVQPVLHCKSNKYVMHILKAFSK